MNMLLALKIGQIAEIGSLTSLIGMGMTFLVFFILLGFMAGLQKTTEKKSKKAPIIQNQPEPKENDEINNSSLVAAITAAISMILSEEKPQKAKANFVVKSIKRINCGG